MRYHDYYDFEWDEHKAAANIQKHGVSFEEAATVFLDGCSLTMEDREHSFSEQRYLVLGLSHKTRELVVVHCYRDLGSVIRIISARAATKNESKQYWRRWHA